MDCPEGSGHLSPRPIIHSGLLKVWRMELAVRSSLRAVSRGTTWLILRSVRAGRLRTHRRVLLLAARALGSARLPGGVEPVGECGVAAACSGGADRLGQGAAGSGEGGGVPGGGDAGGREGAPQRHPGRGGRGGGRGGGLGGGGGGGGGGVGVGELIERGEVVVHGLVFVGKQGEGLLFQG